MDETIKFSDTEINLTEIVPREINNNIIPRSWTSITFIIENAYDYFQIKSILTDWLQTNTKKGYSIHFLPKTNNTSISYAVTTFVYFEDANDALYTKLVGYDYIKEAVANDKIS